MRIFDKEKYIENMGVPIGCEERWVNECDGKKVVRVEEENETYQVVGLPYNVAKVWTKEVDDIKTLEELGYEKVQDDEYVSEYHKKELDTIISFREINKSVFCKTKDDNYQYLTMEELKAIYKYCEDSGGI